MLKTGSSAVEARLTVGRAAGALRSRGDASETVTMGSDFLSLVAAGSGTEAATWRGSLVTDSTARDWAWKSSLRGLK
jgi:hypothetical protein